mmetsp:Transcript_28955/g.35217  ORF Transcript_28955/g.35217 Transcript_28955/m.35217 type:complete len:98 (+) Transcript_28955:139-432(+)
MLIRYPHPDPNVIPSPSFSARHVNSLSLSSQTNALHSSSSCCRRSNHLTFWIPCDSAVTRLGLRDESREVFVVSTNMTPAVLIVKPLDKYGNDVTFL